jgi:hypothetical protein
MVKTHLSLSRWFRKQKLAKICWLIMATAARKRNGGE